jgi:hypothetical protein
MTVQTTATASQTMASQAMAPAAGQSKQSQGQAQANQAKGKSKKSVVLGLEITAAKVAHLHIVGHEKGHPETVFFVREKEGFSGTELFEFPLPVRPGELKIKIVDLSRRGTAHIKIKKVIAKPLKNKGVNAQDHTLAFIDFALTFAANAAIYKPGVFKDAARLYQIKYLDRIKDYDTGKILETPARISHDTGIIEASREAFLKLTVPNRLFILIHEYVHVANDTYDETECDLIAAKTLLDLGFSKLETLYSLTRLFEFNTHRSGDIQRDQEERVKLVEELIKNYQ